MVERIQKALERLENSKDFAALLTGQSSTLILGYHGLAWPEVEKNLKEELKEIISQYKDSSAPFPSRNKTLASPPPSAAHPMETSERNFADELKRLLAEAKWKPEDVPDHMQIDCRTVYRHLRGSIPSRSTIWAYEEAFTKRLGRKIELPQMPAKRHNASRMSAKSQ